MPCASPDVHYCAYMIARSRDACLFRCVPEIVPEIRHSRRTLAGVDGKTTPLLSYTEARTIVNVTAKYSSDAAALCTSLVFLRSKS